MSRPGLFPAMSRGRLVLLAVLVLVLVSVGFSTVYRAAWDSVQRTDYTVYTAAGQAVLDGGDIYQAHNVRGWNFVYPPPFALLMAPLSELSRSAGSFLWFLLEIAAIGATSVLSVTLVDRPLDDTQKDMLYSLPLFSLSTLLVSGVMRCQASAFMFLFIVAAFHFSVRGRQVGAGASLALAAALKVFPLVLASYFLVRRQYLALSAMLVTLLAVVLLLPSLYWGWHRNEEAIADWVNVVARPALMTNAERKQESSLYAQLLDTQKSRNQSLESLFLTVGARPAEASRLVTVASVVMFLLMLAVTPLVNTHEDEMALAGAFVVWALLASPIAETHYFGALILPLTALISRILFGPVSPRQRRLRIAALTGLMMGVMVLIGWEWTESLRPLCIASLGLWVALLWSILRGKPLTLPVTAKLFAD